MVSSDQVDRMGFVVDFVELKNRVGRWIDENWDHAFLINKQDSELLQSAEFTNAKEDFHS